jgi:CelD/BcsL family acetyltransferase involved in cellulose biosynthesis
LNFQKVEIDNPILISLWRSLDGGPETCVFQQYDFIKTWLDNFQDKTITPFIYLVYEGDSPVGILPFYILRTHRYFIPVSELRLLGDEGIGSNYLTAFLGKIDKAVWTAFKSKYQSKWSLTRFKMLSASFAKYFDYCEQGLSLSFTSYDGTICPRIQRIGGIDDFLSLTKGKKRNKFKRILKNYDQNSDLTIQWVNDFDKLSPLWEDITRLAKSRFKDKEVVGGFAEEEFENFHHLFLKRSINRNWVFALLKEGNQLIGFHYYYHDMDSIFFYQGGISTDHYQLSPGLLLHLLCIRHAKEFIGLDSFIYDFLEGDERYKFEFTKEVNRLYEVVSSNKRLWELAINLNKKFSARSVGGSDA